MSRYISMKRIKEILKDHPNWFSEKNECNIDDI